MTTKTEHQVIWLQPWCGDCDPNGDHAGRCWCEDDAWGPCEECGAMPVKYVIAADQPKRRDAEDEAA